MNTEPIISVRNITKSYKLYSKPADRLKEVLWPWKQRHSLFHALHDVSFEVHKGEHLGLIGVNGAGKSTLLQILSGVLTPTSGTVTVNGRVAALLELGAGFNAELTGRENVTFQMQLADIQQSQLKDKIAEVEAFADVGEFFDQPAKVYSSGMFARVAFASAILCDPDILIVDEALAVGDVRFQKKCMDRMRQMKEQGITILLVSHDVFGTKASSTRMILLDKGKIVINGSPEDVATAYFKLLYPEQKCLPLDQGDAKEINNSLNFMNKNHNEYVFVQKPDSKTLKWGACGASLLEMRIFNLKTPNIFFTDRELIIECDYFFDTKTIVDIIFNNNLKNNIYFGFRFDNATGIILTNFASALCGNGDVQFNVLKEKTCTFRFFVTLPELQTGNYFISPGLAIGSIDNYYPIFSYENFVTLFCAKQREIHGIFRVNQTIERVK